MGNEIIKPTKAELMAGFEDVDSSDLIFPVLSLYQGTMEEEEKYAGCGFKRGDWIDTNAMRVFDGEVAFVAATKFASVFHKKGSPAGRGLAFMYPSWNDVPPDVEANPQYDVTRGYMLFLWSRGEAYPFVVRAKRTGIKSAKVLLTTEKGRATAGKLPGLYKLMSKKQVNPEGQPYLVPIYGPTGGSVTDADFAEIATMRQMIGQNREAVMAKLSEDEGAPAPAARPAASSDADDEIPF